MDWMNVILCAVCVVVLIGLIVTMYVKAPPNIAYIISGWKSEPRILKGQGGLRIPFLERLDKLYLGQMSVDVKTGQPVPTNDFINVSVDAVAKVQVERSPEGIRLAAKNFLNEDPKAIAEELQDSLEGNMREIVGTLTLKDINTDRDSFSDQVMNKAAIDMKKLGIEILSCNIQNVTDENGLIRDLGMDNTSKIKKDAAIAKANAERDVKVVQAEADKTANEARVKADTVIAEQQNQLAIKKSELKRQADIKQAEADAAYEIQRQEQMKTIQTATVNAEIAKTEREAELKMREVSVKEQTLAAEIKKQAEAEKYAVEQQAQAELAKRKLQAEAELFEQQKIAEAIRAKGQAEADAIRMKGEAEASAIKAKGEAEAAAMDKRAEAMKKYGHAAMAEMAIKVIPQVAAEIAKPLSSIDKVTVIGGSASSASSVADNVPLVMARTFETIKASTGIDLAEIARSDTYDAKVNRNVNVSGLEGTTLVNLADKEIQTEIVNSDDNK
jgi:flotillin